jgi:hypothetical protein
VTPAEKTKAKNYREYGIRRPGFMDGIKVRVYKTPEAMRKGIIAEHVKFSKWDNTDLSDTVGMFFYTRPLVSDKAEGLFMGNIFGTMFLNEKQLTPEIIIHECCHAAFSVEEFISRFSMDYSDDKNCAHEERFCYYLGWLAAELLQILEKDGYFRSNSRKKDKGAAA